MVKTLVRLVYKSRSNLLPDNVEQLDSIFRTAVRCNLRDGISGCLVHPVGHFLQVIEGEASKIDTLMARLMVDPRHTDVVVLARRPTLARMFSSWAMARPAIEPLADDALRILRNNGSGDQVSALLLDVVAKDPWLYRLI